MECPYCGNKLHYHDYYGKNLRLDSFDKPKSGFVKSGDIYRCDNEDCEMFDEYFYTYEGSDLQEGYPC